MTVTVCAVSALIAFVAIIIVVCFQPTRKEGFYNKIKIDPKALKKATEEGEIRSFIRKWENCQTQKESLSCKQASDMRFYINNYPDINQTLHNMPREETIKAMTANAKLEGLMKGLYDVGPKGREGIKSAMVKNNKVTI